jgi:FkbM family methyltransferase
MTKNFQLWWRAQRARRFRRAAGAHVQALLVDAGELRFAVDPEDYGVGRALRRDGHYARDEIERLQPLLRAQDTALVVGAHIGALALPLARRCRELVAIEANPHSFELLRTNIAINGIGNCRALNVAASDRDETLPFLLSRVNSGGSKRQPLHAHYRYTFDKPALVNVPAHALDTLLAPQQFDFILMDIEGSEHFALAGMPRLLQACRTLVVEFMPQHLADVGGVTARQFAQPLLSFDSLQVPSKHLTVGRDDIVATLEAMVARGESDAGLIFSRRPHR